MGRRGNLKCDGRRRRRAPTPRDRARLAAVDSRELARAQEFSTAYADGGLPRSHGSYEELVDDSEVEVVYVASPHALHLEHARLALEAGRFGTPRHLHAELGFVVGQDDPDRLFDASLGASALLDMGIYPLTFAHLMFGEAETLTAVGNVQGSDAGSFDVDLAMTGRYAGGVLATLVSSMTSWSSRAAAIATDLGRIDLADFHHPGVAVFTEYAAGSHGTRSGRTVEITGAEPVIGRGYGNEIVEVGRCLREGLRESPLVPLAQTLTLLRQMDGTRAMVGARYAGE